MDKYQKIREAAIALGEALNELAADGTTFDVMAHAVDVTTYADSAPRFIYNIHVRQTAEKDIC